MSLTLEKEVRHDVQILHLRGRITLGEGTRTLHDTVRAILAAGAARIVLDLSEIGIIDSAGIGELVSTYTSVTSQGGQLALVGLQKKLSDLLKITKLYTVFQVYESVDQAVASWSATRTAD